MRSATVRSVLAAAWFGAAAAPLCSAQDLRVPVECGIDVRLTGSAMFSPPVAGAVEYEWRDASNRVVGREETLRLGQLKLPVGSHLFTLTATGAEDRRPARTLLLVVTDTTPPRVRIPPGPIPLPSGALQEPAPPGVTITDQCDPTPTITFVPPGPYGPGDNRVTMRAQDASGNGAEVVVSFQVPRPAPPPPPVVEPPPPPPPPPPQPVPAPPPPAPTPVQVPDSPVLEVPLPARAVPVVPPPVDLEVRYPWWVAVVALLVAAAATKALKKRADIPVSEVHARTKLDTGSQRVRLGGPGSFRIEKRSADATGSGDRGEGA